MTTPCESTSRSDHLAIANDLGSFTVTVTFTAAGISEGVSDKTRIFTV